MQFTLPTLCLACHRWAGRAAPALRLCAPCAAQARRLRPPPASAAGLDVALAALPYAPPWSGWVVQLKFAGAVGLARAMAAHCGSVLQDAAVQADLVVPVPLSLARLRSRGYNQAWLLARPIARGLGPPARDDLLIRRRDTRAQTELGLLERQANLAGAFEVPPPQRGQVKGQRILLVDDVQTTGATLAAAAAALRSAGAASVVGCSFARTHGPLEEPAGRPGYSLSC